MRIRTRFIAVFVVQAVLGAAFATTFALRTMGTEYARAEGEFRLPESSVMRARDARLSEGERLAAALAALESARAAAAASRVFRTHAVVEAARGIGVFVAAGTAFTAALFALAAASLTRRLDELAAGSLSIATDRAFRFPAARDREFGPVFASINAMLDTIAEQESHLEEAARLEGWREVSSFLFHQLRSPLSALEYAARNVSLAAEKARTGDLGEVEALRLCSGSAGSARLECERLRSLLDRFRDLSGLSMGTFEPLAPSSLLRACMERLQPGRAALDLAGDEATVTGDRRMLEEAFMNLVRNIVEACPAPPARIGARIRRQAGSVIVELTDDNGPVDPSLPARAGRERFSTKVEGTGLGLLFVRRVTALHGGNFEAFLSEEGGFGARLVLPSAGECQSEESGPRADPPRGQALGEASA